MTLNDLHEGQTAKVLEVNGMRLLSLGVIPNSNVRIIKNQSSTNGFMVRINETMTLIMDERCARKIVVEINS